MTTKIDCPCCGSPDTVSYWAKVPDAPIEGTALAETHRYQLAIMKIQYPEAGRCIDCDYVWPYPPRPPIDLSRLTIAD